MAQLAPAYTTAIMPRGDVGSDRDGPAGVGAPLPRAPAPCLEADEAEHRDDSQNAEGAEPGRGEAGRREGGEAEPPARGVSKPGDRLGEDDQDL